MPNAQLYIDYSISGLVQVPQNMPNTVTSAQRIKVRILEIQMKTGPMNKTEIKKFQNQKDFKQVEQEENVN